VRQELDALTKSGKTLGVMSFYNPYLYNAEGEKCLVSKVLFANFEEKRAESGCTKQCTWFLE
jgi:hypothetical protein